MKRCWNSKVFGLLMACFLTGGAILPAHADVTYTDAGNYIQYADGTLPIVISLPHAGTVNPNTIPTHDGVQINDYLDFTKNLADQINDDLDAKIAGTARPYIIYNTLVRRKLDPNRDNAANSADAYNGPIAEAAWGTYHEIIENAKASALASHGRVFYIDLHAHSHTYQHVELGYALSWWDLYHNDTTLESDRSYVEKSTFKNKYDSSYQTTDLFADMLRGNLSLGHFVESVEGAPYCTPSPSIPLPFEVTYNDGQYSVYRHCYDQAQYAANIASGDTNVDLSGTTYDTANQYTDGVQVEVPSSVLIYYTWYGSWKLDVEEMEAFSDQFVTGLIAYLNQNYGPNFLIPAP
jgi:hypothetical protein